MEDLDELIETYYTARHTLSEKEIQLFEQLYATDEEFKQKANAQKLLIRAIRMKYAEVFLNKEKKQKQIVQLATGLAASIVLLLGFVYFANRSNNSPKKPILTQAPPIKNTTNAKDSLLTSTKKNDIIIKTQSESKPEFLTFEIKEEEQMGYTPTEAKIVRVNFTKSESQKILLKSGTYYIYGQHKPESVISYKNNLYFKLNQEFYTENLTRVTDNELLEKLKRIDF